MKTYIEKNKFLIFITLSYIVLSLYITQFQSGMSYSPDLSGARIQYNFEPFIKFKEALTKINTTGLPGGAEASRREVLKYTLNVAYGFFANILLFIPLGVLLPALNKRFNNIVRVGMVGFLTSLFIELCQVGVMLLFIVNKRVFDVDDLIANTLGAIIGYLIYAFFSVSAKHLKRRIII